MSDYHLQPYALYHTWVGWGWDYARWGGLKLGRVADRCLGGWWWQWIMPVPCPDYPNTCYCWAGDLPACHYLPPPEPGVG